MSWRKIEVNKDDSIEFRRSYKKQMKFLVDENIEDKVIYLLKKQDWNVKSYKDFNLKGKPDDSYFEMARKYNRVLLTKDKDFWDNNKFPIVRLNNHPGVIILEYQSEETALSGIAFIRDSFFPFAKIFSETKIKIHGAEVLCYDREGLSKYKVDNDGVYEWYAEE